VFVYTLWLKPRTPQNIVIGAPQGGAAAGRLGRGDRWKATWTPSTVRDRLSVDATHFWALACWSRTTTRGGPMLRWRAVRPPPADRSSPQRGARCLHRAAFLTAVRISRLLRRGAHCSAPGSSVSRPTGSRPLTGAAVPPSSWPHCLRRSVCAMAADPLIA
jgi:hypothetical protein